MASSNFTEPSEWIGIRYTQIIVWPRSDEMQSNNFNFKIDLLINGSCLMGWNLTTKDSEKAQKHCETALCMFLNQIFEQKHTYSYIGGYVCLGTANEITRMLMLLCALFDVWMHTDKHVHYTCRHVCVCVCLVWILDWKPRELEKVAYNIPTDAGWTHCEQIAEQHSSRWWLKACRWQFQQKYKKTHTQQQQLRKQKKWSLFFSCSFQMVGPDLDSRWLASTTRAKRMEILTSWYAIQQCCRHRYHCCPRHRLHGFRLKERAHSIFALCLSEFFIRKRFYFDKKQTKKEITQNACKNVSIDCHFFSHINSPFYAPRLELFKFRE